MTDTVWTVPVCIQNKIIVVWIVNGLFLQAIIYKLFLQMSVRDNGFLSVEKTISWTPECHQSQEQFQVLHSSQLISDMTKKKGFSKMRFYLSSAQNLDRLVLVSLVEVHY